MIERDFLLESKEKEHKAAAMLSKQELIQFAAEELARVKRAKKIIDDNNWRNRYSSPLDLPDYHAEQQKHAKQLTELRERYWIGPPRVSKK